MTNYQVGYGHGDVVGVPFDFYAGATVVTGSTITMQTGVLVVLPPATLAALTINLPLNPTDGADASITLGQIITALTVNANTGDTIATNTILLNVTTAGAFTPVVSAAAGSAAGTIRYKYTLNGFQPASGAAVNPRTWIRVQ
jgi:hypothetical protein